MSFVLAILWVIFAALLCWQLLRWLPAGADKYNPLPYIIALLPLSTYVVVALLFFSIFATEWQVLYASKNPQSYNFAQSYAYLCIAYAVLFLISLKSYTPYWFGRFRSARLQMPENYTANVSETRQNSNKRRKITRQMFPKNAKTATNAGKLHGFCGHTHGFGKQTPRNYTANVSETRQNSNKRLENQYQEIRVMTLNCRYGKANAAQIIETAKKYHINTLLLQELSESLVKNLEKLGIYEIFPTSCVGSKSEHNNGGFNAIFTQYSAISTCNNAVKIEAASVPSVTTYLDFGDAKNVCVKFASAHPKSPMRGCSAWSEGIRALAKVGNAAETAETAETCELSTLTILTGDLNSSIDHPSFRSLLKSGFLDASICIGKRLKTWPTWLKWPNLTLDHVLFCAKNLHAKAVWQKNAVIDGTDHLAYIAAIALYSLE
ncbi:endonuclease/exonuclease/phosphatase family protein [Gardnerella greenwoodii]|uniref:endonuclease/exonuclease/phosphatase family protein n=1 Tax=Gardnerella greenwoodii TaxID=2914925 RepID=UPI0039F107CB